MELIDKDMLVSTLTPEWKSAQLRNSAIAKRWMNAIVSMPTVDAVPVVRCYNCKYGYLWTNDGHGVVLIGDHQFVPHNGFCFCGERKEDEYE